MSGGFISRGGGVFLGKLASSISFENLYTVHVDDFYYLLVVLFSTDF